MNNNKNDIEKSFGDWYHEGYCEGYDKGYRDGSRYGVGKNERHHGEWIKSSNMSKKSYQRVCNQCHHISYFCGDGNYPYCPYCLADMREADNE